MYGVICLVILATPVALAIASDERRAKRTQGKQDLPRLYWFASQLLYWPVIALAWWLITLGKSDYEVHPSDGCAMPLLVGGSVISLVFWHKRIRTFHGQHAVVAVASVLSAIACAGSLRNHLDAPAERCLLGCSIRVIEKVPSPDGRLIAQVEEWDRGALGSSVLLFVSLDGNRHKTLIWNCSDLAPNLRWIDGGRLEVIDPDAPPGVTSQANSYSVGDLRIQVAFSGG